MNNKYANMIQGLTKEYSDVNRNAEAKALVEKWSRTGLLTKMGGKHKSNMARLLENEAIGLRKLNEGSSVGDIAGFNKIAFPLVRRVFAQLIANEIVSVQPMSLPSGLLFYLDFDYDRNNARVKRDYNISNQDQSFHLFYTGM